MFIEFLQNSEEEENGFTFVDENGGWFESLVSLNDALFDCVDDGVERLLNEAKRCYGVDQVL